MNRRLVIPTILLGLYSLGQAASAKDGHEDPVPKVELTEAEDMSLDGDLARKGRMPILLLVSQIHCPFCDQIKREILHPMLVAGDYRESLLIREIFIDIRTQVRDFKGRYVDTRQFATDYGVHLTPTLLFLDPEGRELTERMVGINTPEMYFYYVDASIKQAIAALRQ